VTLAFICVGAILPLAALVAGRRLLRIDRHATGADDGDRFYVIADGEVEIVCDRQVAATRSRGEGFGEIALIYDVARTATVTTRRPTQLYSLDSEAFLLAVTGHASAQRAAHDLATARLEELRAMDETAAADAATVSRT
jgi:CRP-like cAMP-binding protein